jgi:hypothetical protein
MAKESDQLANSKLSLNPIDHLVVLVVTSGPAYTSTATTRCLMLFLVLSFLWHSEVSSLGLRSKRVKLNHLI